MFRSTRDDTLIRTIEARYRINLNARGDTKIGNLLDKRRFDSLSQLLKAYYGNLTYHACKRRLFLSFHAEDLLQVRGFRLMAHNPNLEIDFYDNSVREPVNSERSWYIKQRILPKIQKAEVIVCLIGNGTAWRDWVNWELQEAIKFGKGLCGIRLKGSHGRTPSLLAGMPVVGWGDTEQIIAAIECAAARRCY